MTVARDETSHAVVLHPDDHVAVLTRDVAPGETIAIGGALGPLALQAAAAIQSGHKVALRDLAAGSDVRKYGEVIGRLSESVGSGGHVHVHNLRSLRAT